MKKIDNKNGHKGTIYILLRLRVSIVAMRSLSATLWNNLAIGLCGSRPYFIGDTWSGTYS